MKGRYIVFSMWMRDFFDDLKPRKKIYPFDYQIKVHKHVVHLMKKEFDYNEDILSVIFFGSLLKLTFGKYEKPTFNGREGSDIDIFLIVKTGFTCDWELIDKTQGGDKYHAGKIDKIHDIQIIAFCPKKHDLIAALQQGMPANTHRMQFAKVLFERIDSMKVLQ